MTAVILAAGRGTRLNKLTSRLPKGLLQIDGKSLLERSLAAIKKNKITQAIIVIGHYGHLIQEKIGNDFYDLNLSYIRNPNYAKTGSMYSLWQIHDSIHDDILLLESDLLYEERAIPVLLESKYSDVILVSSLLDSGDDVYVCTNEKEQLILLGKEIEEDMKSNALGALVGISKLSKQFLRSLFDRASLEFKTGQEELLNQHYEECINKVSVSTHPVYTTYLQDLVWIEIDNHNDLRRARREIYPRIIADTQPNGGVSGEYQA
jgi:2-aminoethylphosphonate-pyruvate transaminase